MTNRIRLILYNPQKATKLSLTVGIIIGLVNISVFCVWVPARLQISPGWQLANSIWDRTEKCIFLIIDASLNFYFMWLIRSKLIANGLTKYRRVFFFNIAMVCFSISLDVS